MRPLFKRRKHLKELAEREATGESFWTSDFDEPVRIKVMHAVNDATLPNVSREEPLELARALVIRDEGVMTLKGRPDASGDFLAWLQEASADDFASAVEALHSAMAMTSDYSYTHIGNQEAFAARVNEIFTEHRVAYELINGEMIPFESKELHAEVVVPTLQLLAGFHGWAPVEDAYQKALEEIGKDPGDAITDAARALEEALRLMGCSGNSLGKLITDAKKQGLLGPYDSKLSDGIEKIMDWVAAERGEKSDAHAGEDGLRDDAWLAVHIVGAVIIRLASRPGRGATRGGDYS